MDITHKMYSPVSKDFSQAKLLSAGMDLMSHPIPEIGAFEAHYTTARGEIVTHWHYEKGKPVFHYTLPEGVTAEVI